jgi:hypothetical protein
MFHKGRSMNTIDLCGQSIIFESSDYIHLNPARAKLTGVTHGEFAAYRWSCSPALVEAGGRIQSGWKSEAGCYLIPRCRHCAKVGISEKTHSGTSFLVLLEKRAKALKGKGSHSGKALQTHDESTSETIVKKGLDV